MTSKSKANGEKSCAESLLIDACGRAGIDVTARSKDELAAVMNYLLPMWDGDDRSFVMESVFAVASLSFAGLLLETTALSDAVSSESDASDDLAVKFKRAMPQLPFTNRELLHLIVKYFGEKAREHPAFSAKRESALRALDAKRNNE